MAAKKPEKTNEVSVMTVERGKASFCLVGTEPLLHNCLSNKAKHELLLPSGRKTATEKATMLKHVPLEEFQDSIYHTRIQKGEEVEDTDDNPTFIQHLSSAFRGAMRSAALDLPGVTKAEIGRLLWVDGDRVNIFGVPEMDMRIVRQAGMNRAPDVRTRCIMREWACAITVSYTKPQLKVQAVANLLSAAGLYIGIGDYRNEKGAGNYGLWRICGPTDKDYKRIVKAGGRQVQIAAMDDPGFYNEETDELYNWWVEAVKDHRAFKPMTVEASEVADGAGSNGKSEGAEAPA